MRFSRVNETVNELHQVGSRHLPEANIYRQSRTDTNLLARDTTEPKTCSFGICQRK
jgi:hypothetical protein